MSFIDLFYPKHCPICLDALPPGKALICAPCEKKIRRVTGPTCVKCGKPLADDTYEYCVNCEKRPPAFRKGIAWAEYTSKYIRRMLSEVKYHENPQLLDYPCQDFAKRILGEVNEWHAEALIPVPVHESRRRIRGYNQAEEIAVRLGAVLGIPTDPNVLFRREKTRAQKELNDTERRNNLAVAFGVRDDAPLYRTVILVDDIYTTGSTADACARTLLKAGIEEVFLLTLAIGRDHRIRF